MKTYIFILLSCFLMGITGICPLPAQEAQKSYLEKRDKAIWHAYRYLNGYYFPLNYEKAHWIFSRLAETGDAEALNALGMMHKLGQGVEQSDEKALEYFLRSAEKGYVKATYNLALCYRYGHGVKQDFSRALDYFRKAEALGDQRTDHMIGYFYYKGFGVEQDYEKAVQYLHAGADKGHAGPMYLLAQCYFQGRGVERDVEKGKYWVKQAAEKGLSRAIDFMWFVEDIQTFGLNTLNLRKASSDPLTRVIPDSWTAVAHEPIPAARLEGAWEGKIVRYDWSGKEAESEINLQVSFQQEEENQLSGVWIQDDTLSMPLAVTLTDSLWIFNQVKIQTIRPIDVLEGRFCLQHAEGEEFLTGTLTTYSELVREYQEPAFIALRRATHTTAIPEPTEHKNTAISVSPNPFQEELTVRIHLPEPREVLVEIYDMSGGKIYGSSYRKCHTGENTVSIPTGSFPAGNYLLKVRGENIHESVKIIK